MSSKYKIAIIGAGVIGTSIAWQLTRRGAEGILILDKEDQPGTGSTSKANGGIRAQFTTDINIKMSLLSMKILDDLEAELGSPPVYTKAGYLFVTNDQHKFEAMSKAAEFQRERGVSVDLLDAPQVKKKAQFINCDDLVGGTFGNRDGFIDPGRLCNWYYSGAMKKGVKAVFGAEVTGIAPGSNGSIRLATSAGDFEAEKVVNAAGPFAGLIAKMAGFELPVEPVRRHIIISGICDMVPKLIPMTIDVESGVLIRKEGDAVLIGYSNPDEPTGFGAHFDPEFIYRIIAPLEYRFPLVAESGINFKHSWAGLYAVSPDHHAILGAAPRLDNFYLANGFSGHGVMHSPATGLCMAELILDGECHTLDISPLSPGRFERGELIHETMVL